MTELTADAVGHSDGSCGPVLETTVGGVLREAAERAAETVALVEGVR
jgi:hypothetical protein